MLTKQGDSRNKINIKKITLYALLVAVCLIVGYLESLLSITLIAIAPGVKLGLSNAVALMLIFSGDIKGAWAVNIARIGLAALLFGSPISLLLSLSGGVASTLAASVLSRFKSVSVIGASILCAVVHNAFQLVAATAFVGKGLFIYLPVLLCLGAVCGAFCGVMAQLVLSKSKLFKI